jgi:hypothetical protein
MKRVSASINLTVQNIDRYMQLQKRKAGRANAKLNFIEVKDESVNSDDDQPLAQLARNQSDIKSETPYQDQPETSTSFGDDYKVKHDPLNLASDEILCSESSTDDQPSDQKAFFEQIYFKQEFEEELEDDFWADPNYIHTIYISDSDEDEIQNNNSEKKGIQKALTKEDPSSAVISDSDGPMEHEMPVDPSWAGNSDSDEPVKDETPDIKKNVKPEKKGFKKALTKELKYKCLSEDPLCAVIFDSPFDFIDHIEVCFCHCR